VSYFPGEDDFLGLLGDPEEGVQHYPNEPDFPPELEAPNLGDSLPDPAEVVRQQCAEWLSAASALRYSAPLPGSAAPPVEVKDALVEVRARLDRLELVYASVMSLKAATAAQAKALEQVADDSWNDRAVEERRSPRREWEGAKERYAYWELDIRPQRQRARAARELADFAKDACERIELAYYGLDSLRRDLAGRMTHLRWESSMEQ
jgi:hypothetical protein